MILGVATSLMWPQVSTWSTQFILHLLLAAIGIIWFVSDIVSCAKTILRHHLSSFLEAFVLDDFLRALYDPETGLIPCMMGGFVGACSMYAFRLDDHERTKLIQASLLTTEEEAQSILLHPGGAKSLLPQSFQAWLHEGKGREETTNLKPQTTVVETVEESASDSSVSEYQTSVDETQTARIPQADYEGRADWDHSSRINQKTKRGTESDRPKEVCFEESRQGIPSGIPMDPTTLLFRILRDRAMERVRPLFASIPESKLEMIGTTAAMGLCAHLLLRLRSSRSVFGSISALCLSGTTMAAFSSVLFRHAVLGSIHDMKSLTLVSRGMLSRSLDRIIHMFMSNKRWRGTFALIILAMIGKQRQIDAPTSKTATVL